MKIMDWIVKLSERISWIELLVALGIVLIFWLFRKLFTKYFARWREEENRLRLALPWTRIGNGLRQLWRESIRCWSNTMRLIKRRLWSSLEISMRAAWASLCIFYENDGLGRVFDGVAGNKLDHHANSRRGRNQACISCAAGIP